MKFLLMLLMIFSIVACSGSKSTNEANSEEAGIELADTEEFIEEDGGSLVDEALTETAQTAPEAMMGSEVKYSDSQSEWVVTDNETLMIIAFKLYGDYEKWKDLAAWNSDKLRNGNQISKGMRLKYMAPSEPFVWNPEGNPYLIKTGDTLGKISTTTYGTKQYWKNIWDNNRPLIKDPNKIFAGFTLYTPNIDGRGVANNN